MGRRPGPNHAEINAQDLLVPTPSDLFTQNSEPIKFFIQRDTGKSFVAWLTATIMKYGGTVVPNVPLSGYILIDPLTESGARLKEKWLDPTGRPHRYIVPYTWARASIVARQLLDVEDVKDAKAVFRDAQSPVLMFIHPGIDSVVWRKVRIDIEVCFYQSFTCSSQSDLSHRPLCSADQKYGGITDCTEETARVIIAPHSKKREIVLWNDLVKRYEPDEAKFIEDVEWVERCIRQGQFERTVHRKPNMGGRKPGGSRIEYTKMDDDNLVKYIAEKIPYAESGGRLGNNLYIELENNKEKYPWAQRHSWHSWRNRYKLRQLLFDVAIKAYVKKHANSGSADQDPSASRSPSDEESGEGPEPDAESEDEAGEAVATTSRNAPSKNKPPKKHQKHNPDTAERPGHPALIPLDNAVDSDSSANSDASSTASHPRPSLSSAQTLEARDRQQRQQ
ncbi:hypothetical protein DL93DRAFT_1702466 [Clavulina sp. PMI_390]|nr:hypothetical protein DL93DRAFT_1702466 [Clavulina sp. PMI_390]